MVLRKIFRLRCCGYQVSNPKWSAFSTLWQIVFSKDYCTNTYYPICSSFKETLTSLHQKIGFMFPLLASGQTFDYSTSDVTWLPRPVNKMQCKSHLVFSGHLPFESSHEAMRESSSHKERPRVGLSAIAPTEAPTDSQPSTTRHVSELLDNSSPLHLGNPSKAKTKLSHLIMAKFQIYE